MTRFFTLLLFCFLISLSAWAQTLSIINPTNGATGVSQNPTVTFRSTSTGNSDQDPDIIYVEVSNNPDFDGSDSYFASDDYERIVDITEDIENNFAGLLPATLYYARAYSYKNDEYSSTITFTTAGAAVIAQVTARYVVTPTGSSGNTALPTGIIPSSAYANNSTIILRLNQAAANATRYEWQFDSVSTAFTNVNATLTSSTSDADGDPLTVAFANNSNNFRSGQTYFVRVRGVNNASQGPWSTSTNIRRFVNALHPVALVAPTGSINRTSFKIWADSVARSTRIYFQVSTDPAFADPGTYFMLTGPTAYKNETVAGIAGNVFRHNYRVQSELPNKVAFDYLTGLTPGTTYYIRARAWNPNQSGYWSSVGSVTPMPVRTVTFKSPTSGATDLNTGVQFIFSDDPYFTESGYDFQLSRDNFATFDVNVSNQPGRTYFAPNLQYGTTYQARVRSYASPVDASPTAWTTITFTTKEAPGILVTFPSDGLELPNKNVHFYATWEGGLANWEWQVEKLNAPTSSTTKTSPTYATNFATYLQPGGSYRVRVRGVSTTSVVGDYSPWVNFTVAGTAPMPDFARIGEEGATQAIAFPNPFQSSVTITNPTGAARTLVVLDAAGKAVIRTSFTGMEATFGQNLRPGIYQVILSGAEGVPAERMKVVKQ